MNSYEARLEVGACSETGYVRDENQDRMSGTRVPLGQLYIVADGMGGHKGGALAAELTVQGLQRYIGEASATAAVKMVIQTAFHKTNETVYREAHSGDPTTAGMGSTAVLLLISGQIASVAHVGDSRAYLYRKGRLKQLTTDHTVVQKMVQAGILRPEEASTHPNASVLERAVGSSQEIEVDVRNPVRLHAGDAILLCSDGLCGYVSDEEISSVLRSRATAQELSERLVNLALQKGGEDNVTVQFVQYGTRKDALSRKTEPMTTLWLLRLPWRTAVLLVFGVVLAVFIAIMLYRLTSVQETSQPSTSATNSKHAEHEGNGSNVPLPSTQQAVQTEVDNLQKQLDDANTTVSKLQKELEKATAHRDKLKEALKASEAQKANESTQPKASTKP